MIIIHLYLCVFDKEVLRTEVGLCWLLARTDTTRLLAPPPPCGTFPVLSERSPQWKKGWRHIPWLQYVSFYSTGCYPCSKNNYSEQCNKLIIHQYRNLNAFLGKWYIVQNPEHLGAKGTITQAIVIIHLLSLSSDPNLPVYLLVFLSCSFVFETGSHILQACLKFSV